MDLLVQTTGAAAPAKANPGRFRPGDPRINRFGRPIGTKKPTPEGSPPEDRAPRTDRLMVLRMDAADLVRRLSYGESRWNHDLEVLNDLPGNIRRWISNFPENCTLVSCRFDVPRGAIALILHSQEFQRVARGAVIPLFEPEFCYDWECRCRNCGNAPQ